MLRGVDVLNIEILAHRPTHTAAATLHVFLSLFMTKKKEAVDAKLAVCCVERLCVLPCIPTPFCIISSTVVNDNTATYKHVEVIYVLSSHLFCILL